MCFLDLSTFFSDAKLIAIQRRFENPLLDFRGRKTRKLYDTRSLLIEFQLG